MKKLIFLLLILITSYLSNAQKIFGLQVGGTLSKFDDSLVQKNFKLVTDTGGLGYLTGFFNGDSVELWVASTPITHQVYQITISSMSFKNWDSIKNKFFSYANEIKKLYGDPVHDFELFQEPYKEGDGYEMQAIMRGRISYGMYWTNSSQDYEVMVTIEKYREVWIAVENAKLVSLYYSENEIIKGMKKL
jgi:hypothetical protein